MDICYINTIRYLDIYNINIIKLKIVYIINNIVYIIYISYEYNSNYLFD